MFCSKCGNNLTTGVKFCPKCGNQLTETAIPNTSKLQNPVKQPLPINMPSKIKMSSKNIYVVGLIAVVFLILLVKMIGGGGSSGGSKAVQKMVKEAASDGVISEEEKVLISEQVTDMSDISLIEEMVYDFDEEMLSQNLNLALEVESLWRDTYYITGNDYWKDMDGLGEMLAKDFEMQSEFAEYLSIGTFDIYLDEMGECCLEWYPEGENGIYFTLPSWMLEEQNNESVKISGEILQEGNYVVLTINDKQYRLEGADAQLQAEKDAEFINVAYGTWKLNGDFVRAIQSTLQVWEDLEEAEFIQIGMNPTGRDVLNLIRSDGAWVGSVDSKQGAGNTVIFSLSSTKIEATYTVEGNVLTITIGGIGYSMEKTGNPVWTGSDFG